MLDLIVALLLARPRLQVASGERVAHFDRRSLAGHFHYRFFLFGRVALRHHRLNNDDKKEYTKNPEDGTLEVLHGAYLKRTSLLGSRPNARSVIS